jgi:uncharacterized protein YprB with RNaseH-like and TPR domain
MRTCIFDLESYGLQASTGLVLCCVAKEYGSKVAPTIVRADQFEQWKNNRSNVEPVVRGIMNVLEGNKNTDGSIIPDAEPYDIYVAHNGTFFDRNLLLSWALKFKLPVFLNTAKFIDPCSIMRRRLRLQRNSLHEAIQFLDIPEKKTQILWQDWRLASFDGDSKALSRIVEHCVADVKALEMVYRQIKRLVKGVDSEGSVR